MHLLDSLFSADLLTLQISNAVRCGGGSSLAPVLLYLAYGDGAPFVVALGIAR